MRWWMSATRPATEFSIGIMPRSASPPPMAENASSNVGHGTGSKSGITSRAGQVGIGSGLSLEDDLLGVRSWLFSDAECAREREAHGCR